MSEHDEYRSAARAILDPEEVQSVLSGAFYTEAPEPKSGLRAVVATPEKPTHYKVICISMYTQDLAGLDHMVDALKARGLTKANRSALIRYALSQVDLDRVPRGL